VTASPAFDSAHFRQVLGHFATGVTVITAMAAGDDGPQPVGLAVNSFTSVSLDPPLVLFCAGTASSTWPRIRAAGHYCVNILGADQESVSRIMAGKSADKFADVAWHPEATGAPIIDGSLGWIDCLIENVIDAGDHELVVGRVQAIGHNEGKPLCYFRGGYAGLGH
jgi:3-hydroxy-9,10-secoandrosta-1,3,5(10)-triene-9,17-dione monooxygenase reductase component